MNTKTKKNLKLRKSSRQMSVSTMPLVIVGHSFFFEKLMTTESNKNTLIVSRINNVYLYDKTKNSNRDQKLNFLSQLNNIKKIIFQVLK